MYHILATRDKFLNDLVVSMKNGPVSVLEVPPEEEWLGPDGGWAGSRSFFAEIEKLYATKWAGDFPVVHLGPDLYSLYVAYNFATHPTQHQPFSVVCHNAPVIGGTSFWLAHHPMLRRKLVLATLGKAQRVLVPSHQAADAVDRLYGRCGVEPLIWPSPIIDAKHGAVPNFDITVLADFNEGSGIENALLPLVLGVEGYNRVLVAGYGETGENSYFRKLATQITESKTLTHIEMQPVSSYEELLSCAKFGQRVFVAQVPSHGGMTAYLSAAFAARRATCAPQLGAYEMYLQHGATALLFSGGTPKVVRDVLLALRDEENTKKLADNISKIAAKMQPQELGALMLQVLQGVNICQPSPA